ncbi:MAG: mannitol dehydrogenase family protein, partial [Euzebyaceae bacterium]|nr:mannitol dehydrogenase family protein [Euzebyaceae bacterium]
MERRAARGGRGLSPSPPVRLDLSTLGSVPAALRPAYDPSGLGIGIVHLGIGAFHRAHQAVYTDDALATGSGNARDWGICGVSQRSRDVPDRLQPQDGLYTVLERDTDATRARVVGCVRQVLLAPESPDELRQRIAAADTRIVSLTVTEKAYRHDPASGRLRVDDPAVAADLADPRPGRT